MSRELNKLVLNHLTLGGHASAAKAFIQETSKFHQTPNLVKKPEYRQQVMESLLRGQVGPAIALLNQHVPHVLDQEPELYFYLALQQFIELYRVETDLTKVLAFAEKELAPRAEKYPLLLEELERTMGMFAFPPGKEAQLAPDGRNLLGYGQRWRTVERVNRVLLREVDGCAGRERSGVELLVRCMAYTQQALVKEKTKFPVVKNYVQPEEQLWRTTTVNKTNNSS